MPPHTKAREFLFAKLGSNASVRNGRFTSKVYVSGVDNEWITA